MIDTWSAIEISLVVATASVLVGTPPAIAFAWVLARKRFWGRTLLSAGLNLPLVVPPVITGFVLLAVLGRNGALGPTLEALGIEVSFSMIGAVVAASVVGFPLYVLSARRAFESVDTHYEALSHTLGRGPLYTFTRVTLPLAWPGIAAGAVLAFARALGEFGATIVLAGNTEGETRTIPLAVYALLESPRSDNQVIILVSASIAISFLAIAAYEILLRRHQKAAGT